MNKSYIFLIVLFLYLLPGTVLAHPGRTAGDGCHYCKTNCDRWGEIWNERHCHGGSAPAPQTIQRELTPTSVPFIFPTAQPTLVPTSTPMPTFTPTPTPTVTPTPTLVPTDTPVPIITPVQARAPRSEDNFFRNIFRRLFGF